MIIVKSQSLPAKLDSQSKDSVITQALQTIELDQLKDLVKDLSIPRHRLFEKENNQQVANFIEQELLASGLQVSRQGEYNNIIASKQGGIAGCPLLIGAHYDSVPNCPGADDNGSAVAALLATARAMAPLDHKVVFVAFNAEEEGLVGSRDFVSNHLPKHSHQIQLAHILEMVGFSSSAAGSQSLPPGLPVKVSDVGDFLAIVSNRISNTYVKDLLQAGSDYVPELKINALKVYLGMEKLSPHLLRSDHSPFWNKKIPAFMWTDTSEFRNPHYHKPSDTPDTLDYEFLLQVTRLLLCHALLFKPQQ